MIETALQYTNAKGWLAKFETTHRYFTAPCPSGTHPALWRAQREAFASMIAEFKEDIAAYERKDPTS